MKPPTPTQTCNLLVALYVALGPLGTVVMVVCLWRDAL